MRLGWRIWVGGPLSWKLLGLGLTIAVIALVFVWVIRPVLRSLGEDQEL